jgi:UDP-N-acetylglucosamine transferase subunit ALG13
LKREFPNQLLIPLPGYNITYKGRGGFFMWDMFRQVPKVTLAISQELAIMEELVQKYKLDMIISDHRLGCRSELCKSYIIAHQINIMDDNGWMGALGTRMNKYFINQFDGCWIPDYDNKLMSLAGQLSVADGLKKAKYIGPLSRMKKKQLKIQYDVAVVLSGPEPARTKCEDTLIRALAPHAYKVAFIRGTTEPQNNVPFHPVLDLADSEEATDILNQSKIVISRSGYSTLMDLEVLNKKAILIPTPGQTEQEYLAQHLSNRRDYKILKERDITPIILGQAIEELINDND